MLVMRSQDFGNVAKFEKAMRVLGTTGFASAGAKALNRAGDQGRTGARRALAKQTGLQQKLLNRAMQVTRANGATLEYRVTAKGGDIALKYFAARETRKGVSANPFGQRRVFEGTFIRGGKFPSRVDIGRGGHVFARVSDSRLPIEKQKSGVIIPQEMVKDESGKAWSLVTHRVLPDRLAHELRRASNGVLT